MGCDPDEADANGIDEPLLPATLTYTYRQRAQQAFAVELLAPIEDVDELLDGDRSEDSCREAAEYFMVSPWATSSLLANNHRLAV